MNDCAARFSKILEKELQESFSHPITNFVVSQLEQRLIVVEAALRESLVALKPFSEVGPHVGAGIYPIHASYVRQAAETYRKNQGVVA